MNPEIYLDSNATTPVLPQAVDAAVHAMRTLYGNPSSSHTAGLRARAMIESVRAMARAELGAPSGHMLFVSGATEGIQTAVLSALSALRERRERGSVRPCVLVYGATEHKAVPESLAHWNRVLGLNLELRALPVNDMGQHDLGVLAQWLPETALLCTMAANNESGAVSDLAAIERLLVQQRSQALWLVDGVQALGKLPMALSDSRIDYAPFSGHKLYAPKGIGLLYVREGAPYTPLMMGGGQEGGARSGTENMAGIAALGAVLGTLQRGDTFCSNAVLMGYRNRVQASLEMAFPGVVFNTPLHHSLPTTLNFSVPGLRSRDLLDVFDAAGVRVSSGSACSAAKAQPSHVLAAMGLPAWRTTSAVRLSLGAMADEAWVGRACEAIEACGRVLRRTGLLAGSQGLVPVDAHAVPVPLMQFNAGTECSWVICDPQQRDCVVINPLETLVDRLRWHVQHHGLHLRAVVPMRAQDESTCARLRQLCAVAEPVAVGQPVQVGTRRLRPIDSSWSTGYVLENGDGAADYVFVDQVCTALMNEVAAARAQTIVCLTRDTLGVFIASPKPVVEQTRSSAHLDEAGLCALADRFPGLQVLDVREPHEQMAGSAVALAGRAVRPLPLSHLASYLPGWLSGLRADTPPLVFVCRSGARSSKALQCVASHGHGRVYQLVGGLASHVPEPIPVMRAQIS